MRGVRVHRFGGPEELIFEEFPKPVPKDGELLLRVKAAGVGPWDAWVRSGKSAIAQPLPLTPGADLSGVVESIGPGVTGFRRGDSVFGATNSRFTGAYAEFALAEAGMIAVKPADLSWIEAASVPVVASTAYQMLFDHGEVTAGTRVLVHGAAGNVGSYAIQLAKRAGAFVSATAYAEDLDYCSSLGADQVIDARQPNFEKMVKEMDCVMDTIGGDTQERSFRVLRPKGILVSSVSQPDPQKAAEYGVRGVFFLVSVTSTGLARIAELLNSGELKTHVGKVLPLASVRSAHEMLEHKPHIKGKIVLVVDDAPVSA